MDTAPITSKAENFAVWTTGGLGNRLRVWRTIKDWRRSGFRRPVSLRYLGAAGGAWCSYDLLPEHVDGKVFHWALEGADPTLIMVNEGAPDDCVVIQGEFLNGVTPDGTIEPFTYSTIKAKMRDALRFDSHTVAWPRSRELLRRTMTPSAWEDFQVLLERYPDHVLEVSVYSRNLGDIPGRNALVWEVRRY